MDLKGSQLPEEDRYSMCAFVSVSEDGRGQAMAACALCSCVSLHLLTGTC